MSTKIPALTNPPSCLTNCLASDPSSALSNTLSILGATESTLTLWTELPFSTHASPEISSIATQPPATPSPAAHAVGPPDLLAYAYALPPRVDVYSRSVDTGAFSLLGSSTSTAGPFSPCDAACARFKGLGVVVAVVGANGVALHIAPEDARPGQSMMPAVQLPGSEGHSCVAVALSPTGFIAAATLDGRVAIWKLLKTLDGESLGPHSFGDAVVFGPRDDCPMHDRVTQLVFSPPAPDFGAWPFVSPCPQLAIAWWTGRVDMYQFSHHWSFAWTHKSPQPTTEGYANAPGTYIAFTWSTKPLSTNTSDTAPLVRPLLALVTGIGCISFLALPDGQFVFSAPVIAASPRRKKRKEMQARQHAIHVKGMAAMPGGLVTLVRDASCLSWTPLPTSRDVEEAVSAALRSKKESDVEEAASVALRSKKESRSQGFSPACIFSDAEMTITNDIDSQSFRFRRSARKPIRIPYPLKAKSFLVNRNADTDNALLDRNDGCFVASSVAASTGVLVVLANSLLLVHAQKAILADSKRDSGNDGWSAIVLPAPVDSCAVSKGITATSAHNLLCCNRDGRLWRWSIPSLEAMKSTAVLPIGVRSIVGCLVGSGCFAALCGGIDPRQQRAPIGPSLALVEDDGSSRCIDLPSDLVFEKGHLGALWYGANVAVVMMACEPCTCIALSINTATLHLTIREIVALPDTPLETTTFVNIASAAGLPASLFDV
jgi:hypothetical protein